ncbi:MAG TPA: ATP cone domain-containing protein, partial [Syntrophales bacterium]|nr:ATP cone domain-containing protein [Syntrophales bacterium]
MKKFIPPRKVKKRDGSVVPFDRGKIENAIYRAAMEVLQEKGRAAFVSGIVTEIVLNEISAQYGGRQIDVESIQDIVERGLMKAGYTEIARSYILYRERRAEIRTAKAALGLRDDLKLSINAMEVLKKRYLLKDDDQNVVEAPGELFRRVARHIAQAEKAFRGSPSVGEAEEKFLSMMRSLEFIPNSPT